MGNPAHPNGKDRRVMNALFEQVRRIIGDAVDLPSDCISVDTLVWTVALCSSRVDRANIMEDLESEFEITLTDAQWLTAETVGDLMELICKEANL
jgi:hypothetical protein